MADGGRAATGAMPFASGGVELRRETHQPPPGARHNPLNAGVARWFAPVTDAADSHTCGRLRVQPGLFTRLAPCSRLENREHRSDEAGRHQPCPRRKACRDNRLRAGVGQPVRYRKRHDVDSCAGWPRARRHVDRAARRGPRRRFSRVTASRRSGSIRPRRRIGYLWKR